MLCRNYIVYVKIGQMKSDLVLARVGVVRARTTRKGSKGSLRHPGQLMDDAIEFLVHTLWLFFRSEHVVDGRDSRKLPIR